MFLGRSWDDFKTPGEKKYRNHMAFESGPAFWINLPPMPDFYDLWNHVHPHEPCILTAVPHGENGGMPTETSHKFAREGKWIWNETHTQIPRHRFHAVLREHKQNYATSIVDSHVVSNILIDDVHQNIVEWENNRGIGILHKSAAETIARLKQLGI